MQSIADSFPMVSVDILFPNMSLFVFSIHSCPPLESLLLYNKSTGTAKTHFQFYIIFCRKESVKNHVSFLGMSLFQIKYRMTVQLLKGSISWYPVSHQIASEHVLDRCSFLDDSHLQTILIHISYIDRVIKDHCKQTC